MRIVSLILVASMIPFAGQSVYGASRAADAVEVGLSNAAVVHEVDTPLGPFVKLSIDQSLNKAKGSIVQRYNISSDKEKLVALTFDDGPSPHTTRILDILDKYKVKATFFLIGKNVDIYPDMAKAIASHGDAIGNHSYSHVPLRSMAKNELAADISAAEQSITNATGVRPKLFRPPFGAYTLKPARD